MRRRALVLVLCLAAAACQDITVTVQHICRGDTFPARLDTSLVRCATLDSMAVPR